MKRVGTISLILLVLVALGFVLAQRGNNTIEAPSIRGSSPIRPVRVEPVLSVTLYQELSYFGVLAPVTQVHVVPKTSGRVAQVLVQMGDTIEEDGVLVLLEADEANLQKLQAEAQVLVARANLSRVLQGARPEELAQLSAGLSQAEASYAGVYQNFQRSERLYEEGVLSKRDWEMIATQYQVSSAQLLSAQKALELAVQGARAEDVQVATASLAQAEATLALADLMVKNATVRSPIAGSVSRVGVERGTLIGAGSLVATIVDTSSVRMHLQVSGSDVVQLLQGQSVFLSVDVLPDLIVEGEVRAIAPATDPSSGLFPVIIEFENPEGRLLPGMHGQARVILQSFPEVFVVPSRILVTREEKIGVFIVKDEQAVFVPLQLGYESPEGFVVEQGLASGYRIVTSGHAALETGDGVYIVGGETP